MMFPESSLLVERRAVRLIAVAVGAALLLSSSVIASEAATKAKKTTKRKVTKKAVTSTIAPDTAAPAATSAPTTSAPAKALFNIGKSQLGDILTTPDGLSLYNFDPDARKPGGSACNGQCADAWPPLIVKSEAELVAPVGFTGKLTTVKRDDGSLQATVNGWPLYGWVFDKGPGDLGGQAVNEVWWLLDPTGALIRTAPTLRFRSNRLASATASSPMMVGTTGNTLYMFEPDKKNGVSTCYDQCAAAWPPLLVGSKAELRLLRAQGIDESKVTLIRRADTSQFQVAFDGWPLYYWARDAKPGDTSGQGVNNVWWVMDNAGKPVRIK